MAKEETGSETIERTPEVAEVSPATFTRDQIRTAILDSKGESEYLTVFGVRVEIRTPDLEDLLQYRDLQGDDTIMARAIANNVYVPDTGEKVFDEADIAALMKTPFSTDMKQLNKTITRVLGGDEQIQLAVDTQTKSDQE